MPRITTTLNDEWSRLAHSPQARRALTSWSVTRPVFAGAADLDVVLERNRGRDGADIRRSLAELASSDDIAARTLLQALLGGICTMARRCSNDGDTIDEFVAIAWERIRTYPTHRPGSVAGNVLLDTRKRYLRARRAAVPPALTQLHPDVQRSAEDEALERCVFDDLVAATERGVISHDALQTIVRSRVQGESLAVLAAEHGLSVKVLRHRRWRAEARLRTLPLAS